MKKTYTQLKKMAAAISSDSRILVDGDGQLVIATGLRQDYDDPEKLIDQYSEDEDEEL